jgi:hypothetical protein
MPRVCCWVFAPAPAPAIGRGASAVLLLLDLPASSSSPSPSPSSSPRDRFLLEPAVASASASPPDSDDAAPVVFVFFVLRPPSWSSSGSRSRFRPRPPSAGAPTDWPVAWSCCTRLLFRDRSACSPVSAVASSPRSRFRSLEDGTNASGMAASWASLRSRKAALSAWLKLGQPGTRRAHSGDGLRRQPAVVWGWGSVVCCRAVFAVRVSPLAFCNQALCCRTRSSLAVCGRRSQLGNLRAQAGGGLRLLTPSADVGGFVAFIVARCLSMTALGGTCLS